MRCQQFVHTKNYCRKNPRCVKCAAQHLTSECPRTTKDDNVKCANCHEKHPANYRGCIINKFNNKHTQDYETIPNRSNLRPGYKRTNRTASNKYTSITHTAKDLIELKQMMKNLLDQMGTLINLIMALINKNN